MDALAREYISLALAADRLFPGLVDGYYGPPQLREETLAAPLPGPATLLARALELRARVDADADADRRPFLSGQARALAGCCRMLGGEELGYAELVRELFDVEAEFTPEAAFEEAIAALDGVLPGSGEVRARMLAWNESFEIDTDAAWRLLELATAELRARTSMLVTLPPGEDVELERVSGNAWSAYNWYLGELLSRVQVETERPLHANDIVDLVAHEMYPGHHTERAVKEAGLYRSLGRGEFSILLTQAPEAVVAEGIAELAGEVAMPGGELYRFQAEVLYPAVGLRGDPEREQAIAAARAGLRGVLTNAAILMHRDRAPEREVEAYLRRYGLRDDAAARANVRFVADPLWCAYAVTYAAGRDLVGGWLDALPPAERGARFARLLAEPVAPAGLRAELPPARA